MPPPSRGARFDRFDRGYDSLMRYVGIFVAVAVAWGGLTLLTTAGLSPKSAETPVAKFESLVFELHQANSAFLDARQRETEGSEGIRAARVSESYDPRVNVLRSMDGLAEATLGTADGADIAIAVFDWSWRLDADLTRLVDRFARLVAYYPTHPDLVDPVGAVASAYAVSGSPRDWTVLLEKLARTTKDDDLRIGSLFVMGQVHMDSGALGLARTTFERFVETYPASGYIPRVRGLIYEIDHLQPGMPAPDFVTKTLDGKPVALASFRGKIVLLNFWATWCPSCIAEVPHLREAYEQLRSNHRPFEILNVSLDPESSMLETVVAKLHMPGVHTWERRGGASPVAVRYNVYGLPAWFLIDELGVIRARDPFGEELTANVARLRE